MKRFAIATATAAALATSAFAYTDASPTMVDAVDNILEENGYAEIDVEVLTDEQIAGIYIAGTSSMDEDEKRKALESYLGDLSDVQATSTTTVVTTETEVAVPANSMMATVENILGDYDMDVDVTTLTDEQVAGIYLAATSTDDFDTKRQKIEAILR